MVNIPYNDCIMLFPNYNEYARHTLFDLIEQREHADKNTAPKIDLAINLICLRQDSKTSQTKLAAALGVNQKNVSQWERGEVAPSLRYLIALAQFYKVTVDRLLTPYKPNF